MNEADWLGCWDREAIRRFLLRAPESPGTERKLRLFACAGCRTRSDLSDPRLHTVVEIVERFADGAATTDDLARSCTELEARVRYLENAFRKTTKEYVSGARVLSLTRSSAADPAVEFVLGGGRRELRLLLSEVFGNPFRPVALSPSWRTDTAVALARLMYDSREFSAMPILADALQDAGCDNEDVLNHCRGPGPHVRGCWVADLVLNKE